MFQLALGYHLYLDITLTELQSLSLLERLMGTLTSFGYSLVFLGMAHLISPVKFMSKTIVRTGFLVIGLVLSLYICLEVLHNLIDMPKAIDDGGNGLKLHLTNTLNSLSVRWVAPVLCVFFYLVLSKKSET
jgi:hypothetical protein